MLQNIINFISPETGLNYNKIPDEIRIKNKLQLLSMAGTLLNAKKSEYFNHFKKNYHPQNKLTGMAHKAFFYATASMVFDYDDFLFAGHTGHSSVNLPLAMTSSADSLYHINGREFLELQTLGNELGARLGASIFLGPHNGQMWTPLHQLAASGIIARLRSKKLNIEKKHKLIQSVITTAMAYPVFPLFDTFFASSSKIYTAAEPLRLAVNLSLDAVAEISGPDFLKEGSDFYRQFSYVPIKGVWQDFEKRWYSSTLSYKKYPGCAYIAGPVQACEEIYREMQKTSLDAASIQKIGISCNLLSKKMDDLSRPWLKGAESSLTSLNFSLPVNCSMMLQDGYLKPESFTRESLNRKNIWELADKIKISHDPAATTKMLRHSSMIPDTFKLLLTNPLKLAPYFRRHGAGKELISWPLDILKSMARQGKKDSIHIDSKNNEYKLFNGANVTVIFKNGDSITKSVDLPDGFAGDSNDNSRKFLEEKLYSAVSAKEALYFLKQIDRFEYLSAREVKEFASKIDKFILS